MDTSIGLEGSLDARLDGIIRSVDNGKLAFRHDL
jgi:hypothetical protein